MRDTDDNPIVLRYGADGHLTQRLPLATMLQLLGRPGDYFAIIATLNAGHMFTLGDGTWLELENRHC